MDCMNMPRSIFSSMPKIHTTQQTLNNTNTNTKHKPTFFHIIISNTTAHASLSRVPHSLSLILERETVSKSSNPSTQIHLPIPRFWFSSPSDSDPAQPNHPTRSDPILPCFCRFSWICYRTFWNCVYLIFLIR